MLLPDAIESIQTAVHHRSWAAPPTFTLTDQAMTPAPPTQRPRDCGLDPRRRPATVEYASSPAA
jgi:hypothetical protein